MTAIRILLADDDRLVREALAVILGSEPELEVVAQAEDGVQACALALRLRPDVVCMDIQMPHRDGLAAIAALREEGAPCRVIVLTTFADDAYIERALTLDVDGYLLKSSSPRELIEGVLAVHRGAACLSPAVARWVLDRRAADAGRLEARDRVRALSPRQREVLALLADGRTNHEIGAALFLSPTTVKGYVSEILDALGVQNRVQAAVLHHQSLDAS